MYYMVSIECHHHTNMRTAPRESVSLLLFQAGKLTFIENNAAISAAVSLFLFQLSA